MFRMLITAGAAVLLAPTAFAGEMPVLLETQKLIASDGMASDKFGIAIEREGDTLIIGAPQHYTNSLPGSFYVFTRGPGGLWSEQARIMSAFQPGEAEFGDLFGEVLALDGDTLLVGAPFAELNGVTLAGRVYVFTRDEHGMWSEHQQLLPSNLSTRRFGSDIALVGDVAVITGAQHVFVFSRDSAGVWSEQTELSAFSGQSIGPVDFDGEHIVVTTGAFDSGDHEAHVLTTDAGNWIVNATIDTPPVFLGAIQDVQLDGDRIALGKPDAAGPDRAYTFHESAADDWTDEATLDPNSLENDSFGMEVALAGDLLLVGANHAGAHGITYLYQRDAAGAWNLQSELMPSDTFAHNFGDEIDFSDNIPVIGSWAHHENGLYAGAVYVFDPIPAPAICVADIVTSTTFEPPGDGTVDAADLAFLLGEWGVTSGSGSPADFVDSTTFQPPPDGVIDAADLAFLLGAWGACE
jgi:hypothetical protein